jgi:hypothetical protein
MMGCLDEDDMLPESFSSLTNLSALHILEDCLDPSGCEPILRLPSLETLSIRLFTREDGEQEDRRSVGSLPLASRKLSSLEIEDGLITSVRPPSSPD